MNNPAERTTPQTVIQVIQENKLDAMPLQPRINDTMLMSPNLGESNLNQLTRSRAYKYNSLDFKSLAENLDTFHAMGYAHRNIKPANMHFYEGRAVLVAHDAAGQLGSFTEFTRTADYVTDQFTKIIDREGDIGKRTDRVNPCKRDQYAFLLSMMQTQFNEIPKAGLFNDHLGKVNKFVSTLSCSYAKRQELIRFLNDPLNNKLPVGLADYFSDDVVADNTAATTLQSLVRRSLVTKFNISKESEKADIRAFRHPDSTILGYEVGENTPTSFPFKRKPSPLAQKGPGGSSKKVSGRNTEFVTLDLNDPAAETASQDVIQVIQENKLEAMPLQLRINDTTVMSLNLGDRNLQDLMESGQYNYDYRNFIELAENLDVFHARGFFHSDIKPNNMFFYKKRVVLTDHDTARAGHFSDFSYTEAYMPKAFLESSTRINGNLQENTWKRDQYSFFVSMMHAQFNELPVKGLFYDHARKVNVFIERLLCSSDRKEELKQFLNDPIGNKLSGSLVDYLKD